MATVITKLSNGNVQIVYPDGETKILNPCCNVTSKVFKHDDNCVGIETNGGTLHLIDWTTVDTEASTKEAFAIELATDYFFDLTQEPLS